MLIHVKEEFFGGGVPLFFQDHSWHLELQQRFIFLSPKALVFTFGLAKSFA